MIRCPFCHTVHVDNTLFCTECGYYMLKETKIKTAPIPSDTLKITCPAEKFPAGETVPDAGPKVIHLKIIGVRRRVLELSLDRVNVLGRVDAAANIFPTVDVSEDGPGMHSVSRRHASIFREGGQVFIKDLGSTNGTFLNGKRLPPYLSTPLHNGDSLQLGMLRIEVKIP
ncbi:FHA domain-containing protein, partial [Candidatus Parcubacteria bacterium]